MSPLASFAPSLRLGANDAMRDPDRLCPSKSCDCPIIRLLIDCFSKNSIQQVENNDFLTTCIPNIEQFGKLRSC